jgi:signal transduction histidine kinase
LRKLFKGISRTAKEHDIWPIALVLAAVLTPAVCLLWFMDAAMRNERLAARERLADAYRSQLGLSQERLEQYWADVAANLEKLAQISPPSLAFAKCVQSDAVDSVVLFDEQGRVIYPNVPRARETGFSEFEPKWTEANQLEYFRKDPAGAAKVYHAIASGVTNVDLAARALQAEARCLVQARQTNAVIQLVTEVLADKRYDRAVDRQGRVIVANAELMALELIPDRNSALFKETARRLEQRLMNYENPALAASQRRFLMKELRGSFPTMAAETLGAEASSRLTNVWRFATPNKRVLALLRRDTILSAVGAIDGNLPPDVRLTLLPPDVENHAAFVTLPAGERFPGWRLALLANDPGRFASATERRIMLYVWTGILVIAAMGVLTVLALRTLRRQAALARLKNDLAATVSHELKTPLASMRVLVDTLLDCEKLNEQTAREYLQLIAHENERLSRLIENFLTFSRLERKKQTFHLSLVPVTQIVGPAIESVRQRFSDPGCRFDVELAPDLPCVRADADALTSALVNLLDNAFKYSGDIKHMVLSVRIEKGNVLFSVRDNGIGIAPRELKRIFQDFYQVDRHLAANGSGCGLGLSIVKSIAGAHDGSVSVTSQPGRGSTFTLSVPAAAQPAKIHTQAMA